MAGLELASVVRQLRTELNEAMADAEGERLRFELGPVELSLTVTLGREATPGAKIASGLLRLERMRRFHGKRCRISNWCSHPATCRRRQVRTASQLPR